MIVLNIISIISCVALIIMASYRFKQFYNRKPCYEEGITKQVVIWYFICVAFGVLGGLHSAHKIFLFFYKDSL